MVRKESSSKEKKILIISEDKKSFINDFNKLLHANFEYVPDGIENKNYKAQNKSKNIIQLFLKKQIKRVNQISLEICYCGKSDPKSIIDYAQEQSKVKEKKDKDKYDKIYCVFDWVSNKGDQSGYKSALNKKISNKITKIISCPSYEYWLFLHFSDSASPYSDNNQLIKELEKLIRQETGNNKFKYQKGNLDDKLIDLLILKLPIAIQNAKTVEKNHKQNYNSTEPQNPSSQIYKLIEYLESDFDLS